MLTTCRARVTTILSADDAVVRMRVFREGETDERAAVAYPPLTGPVSVGDRVVLNTTATGLGLGTGGVDFVIWNETLGGTGVFGGSDGSEHIVKLRYTPLQHAVRTVEMNPEFAEIWETADSLLGTPVIVCGLHSQIGPAAAGVKAARSEARVAYVMTDSAALPIAFSNLVRDLKAAGLIDATLTAGQAFGGDYECVSDASALIAARHIENADVIVVAPGPGNAGTGTRFGFSSIEQGSQLDLVSRLDGTAIGVLRLSLADVRDRHFGLSHHSVTALGRIAGTRAEVVFPSLPAESAIAAQWEAVRSEVAASVIAERHNVVDAHGAPGLALLEERGIRVTSMGRTPAQDPIFFHAAAAAGAIAAAQ